MTDKLSIVNYEGLELAIKVIEQDLTEYTQEERELILGQVLQRMQSKKAELKQQDMMSNAMKGVNLQNLMKRMSGATPDEED